jgi:hypothetical protein
VSTRPVVPRRRRRVRRLLPLVALLALTVVPAGGASGSCAGPELSLVGTDSSAPRIAARGTATVSGRHFVDGCDDTGGQDGFGCTAESREVERPLRDVELVLKQAGRRWQLGSADAGDATGNELGHTTWAVRLPEGVEPGPAVLVTDHGGRLHVRVQRATR